MVEGALQGRFICVDGLMVILVVVPCILQCVRPMIDKTVKEDFVVQENDVRKEITESSQNLTQAVTGEGFELRPWNGRDLFERYKTTKAGFDLRS